jgi:glucosamine-phosphate N-acetyltransferase
MQLHYYLLGSMYGEILKCFAASSATACLASAAVSILLWSQLCTRRRENESWKDSIFQRISGHESTLILRELRPADVNAGLLSLLSELTIVGFPLDSEINARFRSIHRHPDYLVAVVFDSAIGKVVGAATLIVEQKFIHSCGLVGHIEDVVVASSHRGLRLGSTLVEALTVAACMRGCYKVILDCSEQNAAFYEKCGFEEKGVQMARYFE